ncbi:MAG: hypothetical protein WDO13_02145 [Verrucomicrobiota bacterium]
MRTRPRKIERLNYYAGFLGALTYMVARFAFSLTALASCLIGLAGLVIGVILVKIARNRRPKG